MATSSQPASGLARQHRDVLVLGVLVSVHLVIAALWLRADQVDMMRVPDDFAHYWALASLHSAMELDLWDGSLHGLRVLGSYYPLMTQYPRAVLGLLFGPSPLVFRLANVLYLVVLLVSVYHMGRRCHSRRAGLLAAALVSLTPAAYGGVRSLGLDFPAMCMTALAMLMLLMADGFRRIPAAVGFGVCAGLAVSLPWLLSRLRWQRPALAAVALWSVGEGAVLVRPGAGAPYMKPVAVPKFFDDVARMGGQRPILNLPFNIPMGTTMGFAAWHRQPIDGGLGPWFYGHAGHRRRRGEVQLWRTLTAALDGKRVRPPARWTAPQAGGFHYVVLYHHAFDPHDVPRRVARVTGVLGPPCARTGLMSAWVVPGVGQAPPIRARTTPPGRRP